MTLTGATTVLPVLLRVYTRGDGSGSRTAALPAEATEMYEPDSLTILSAVASEPCCLGAALCNKGVRVRVRNAAAASVQVTVFLTGKAKYKNGV